MANKKRVLLSSVSTVLFALGVVRTFLLDFKQLSPNVWETWYNGAVVPSGVFFSPNEGLFMLFNLVLILRDKKTQAMILGTRNQLLVHIGDSAIFWTEMAFPSRFS